MFQLNNEIAQLKTELNVIQSSDPEETFTHGQALNQKLRNRWIMIASEGAVFSGLLLLGAMRIRSTFKKEKELADRQSNFLLSVTHELKSPIASTKLQLQTMQRHELPREKQLDIVASALSDVERLHKLVDNILLAARIENNIILHKERYNISEYIHRNMEETIRTFGYSSQVKLDIDPDIYMLIDRTTFPSIILNLVENAVKYSPPNTPVLLSLKRKDNSVVLAVADEGPGVNPEESEKIFDIFYRSGNEETRKTKGTGLGLFITRYLVHEHNGSIRLKPNKPQGSIFEITFNHI
jgi:K+-sensing histidine kinase KdpD